MALFAGSSNASAQDPIVEVYINSPSGSWASTDSGSPSYVGSQIIPGTDSNRIGLRVQHQAGWWIVLLFHAYLDADSFANPTEEARFNEILANHPGALMIDERPATELDDLTGGLFLLVDPVTSSSTASVPDVEVGYFGAKFLAQSDPELVRQWAQPVLGTTLNAWETMNWQSEPSWYDPQGANASSDTWEELYLSTDSGVDMFDLSALVDASIMNTITGSPAMDGMLPGDFKDAVTNGWLYLDVQALAFQGNDNLQASTDPALTSGLTVTPGTKPRARVSRPNAIRVPIGAATRGLNSTGLTGLAGEVLFLTTSGLTSGSTVEFITTNGTTQCALTKLGPQRARVRIPNSVETGYINIHNAFGVLYGATAPPTTTGSMWFVRQDP